MQLSWLVRRRRMVVPIPARGFARRNLRGGAVLRKRPTSLLVGLPPSALHQHLHSSGLGYVHVCGVHGGHAEARCQARAFVEAPCESAVKWCERHSLPAGMHASMWRMVAGVQCSKCLGVGHACGYPCQACRTSLSGASSPRRLPASLLASCWRAASVLVGVHHACELQTPDDVS